LKVSWIRILWNLYISTWKLNASPSSPTGSSTSVELSSSYLTSSSCIPRRISIRVCVIWIIRCLSDAEFIRAGYKKSLTSTANTNSQDSSGLGHSGALISLSMILSFLRAQPSQKMLDTTNERKAQCILVIVILPFVIIGVTRKNMKRWWNSDFWIRS
jgi:hypothetical protein